jgi:formylglycine-generating enzyme required for sulfatase activity
VVPHAKCLNCYRDDDLTDICLDLEGAKNDLQGMRHVPEMVVVPAGAFTMGSPASEPERQDSERPEPIVSFSTSFAVGKFHVTVDEFSAFVTATGYDAGSDHRYMTYGFRAARTLATLNH